MPNYDLYKGPSRIIRSYHETPACKYLPLPTGSSIINPLAPAQTLPSGTVGAEGTTKVIT